MSTKSAGSSNIAERAIEALIFRSRWLLAVFYVGLIFCLLVLVVRFVAELWHLASTVFSTQETATILGILDLIDLSLLANLVLIVIFSGYESFVSHIESGAAARLAWMGKIDFSGMKVKLMASLAAISGIYLLEALLNLDTQTTTDLAWKVGIHLTFVFSGLFFALTERIETSHAHSDS